MDDYFFTWARQGLLKYDKLVIPFNQKQGKIKMIPSVTKETDLDQLAEIVSNELDSLIVKVEASDKEPNEKNSVELLTRSNKELTELQ